MSVTLCKTAWRWGASLCWLFSIVAPAEAGLSVIGPTEREAASNGLFSYPIRVKNLCPPNEGPATLNSVQIARPLDRDNIESVRLDSRGPITLACGETTAFQIDGTLLRPKEMGSVSVVITGDSIVNATLTTTINPASKNGGNLAAATVAGAAGGVVTNVIVPVGQLTFGLGLLASGGAGAIGAFVGAGLYQLLDPPEGVAAVIQSKAAIALIIIAAFALAVLARRLRDKPLLLALLIGLVVGSFIGIVAGLFRLDPRSVVVVSALGGMLAGIVEILALRRGGA